MKVLHLDSNHDILASMLEDAGYTNHYDYTSSKENILKVISDYDGLIVRSRFPIDQEFLKAAQKLKFIGRVGAGLENIDLDVAQKLHIACYNAPEGNRNAVGEHALGMLLSLFNHLNRADQEVRNGIWLREENRGLELEGKTVGLIGYGNMGKSFARKLSGFDCKVIFYDLKNGLEDKNATQVSLKELQSQADVLSLHTPQTTLTTGMVNKEFIAGFKKPFYLINTARGKSVIIADLVEALESGKVKGAGLDVLEYEKSSFTSLFDKEMPLPFKKLLKMDNVLLSPHVAGWTIESKYKLAHVIASKIIKNHGL
ncbi:2-hydroxyacid dehydrogenase [Nonlabens ulvanivorans]|uniref:2-hydroxyacid dehydrogenase n=1 Tax=Nonlabens ulvanivorans TaxID=906888 RepID=A0A084JT72_NONUL|nr:2-hydroxyacid dehydrogenase [Nonlabens ulvanivorans]KEZ92156.1 2-hydroxyacid dehydrogenase [Nonlabens ulvanivorans]PRX14984.1 D-3-phosphoglycerate dehydrogenase [Nonlabens ulvanivorans]